METQVFFDTKERGFFDASGSATTLSELLTGCDRSNLCLIAGEFGGDKEFRPIDLSGYEVELGFTRPGACPQKGTWTATVNGVTTDALSADVSASALESFLNALSTVSAESGVTVGVSDCNQGPVSTTTASDCSCSDSGTFDKGPLCWNP